MHESVTVLQQRSAVDFQDGGIFQSRVEFWRFQYPALKRIILAPFEPDFLDRSQIDLIQPGIGVGQFLRFPVPKVAVPDIPRVGYRTQKISQLRVIAVKTEQTNRARLPKDGLQPGAIGVDRIKICAAVLRHLEVEPLAIQRPELESVSVSWAMSKSNSRANSRAEAEPSTGTIHRVVFFHQSPLPSLPK